MTKTHTGSRGEMPAPGFRVGSVDALRGIAALVVCLYHLMTRPESPLAGEFGRSLFARHGWLGVQAFFVISGFVVPLAMYRGAYRIQDFGRFVLKRIVRLDPPFLVSIVVVLVLNRLLPGTIDQPVPIAATTTVILGHVFYGFSHLVTDFSWLNSVYWTLEIEFQYYVLIAIILPLLVNRGAVGILTVGGLLGMSLSGLQALALFHWGAVFAFGIVLFMRTTGQWDHRRALAGWAITTLVCWWTSGVAVTVVAVLTTVAISVWKKPGTVFQHLGRLSFSLYLLHIPVGGRILVHAGPLRAAGVPLFLVLLVGIGASALAAHLLWMFVERPAQALAQRITYARRPTLDPSDVLAPHPA